MQTLGDFLKDGREEAGFSLEELAGRTRIRVENLRSLEREDLDALPTDPYVRGFVKQVCRELGLEPSAGLIRYETLRADTAPPDEMTWAEESTERHSGFLERALGDPDRIVRRVTAMGRWGGLLLGAAAAIVAVVLLVRWIDPLAPRTREPVAFLPAESPAVPQPALPAVPVPPEEKAEPAAGPEARTAPPPDDAVDRLVPASETRVAAPAPVRIDTAPERRVPERSAAQELIGARVAGERLVLRVEALRPVAVKVLLDGVGHPRAKSLAAGESKTWKADRLFVLEAEDGGALRVFLDGKDLGTAGPDGRPVKGLRVRSP